MSFESAVANGEEYFEYEGVELKRSVRCNGCDEDLPVTATDHKGCEYAAQYDADDRVYESDPADLLADHYEAQDDDGGMCGYDLYRMQRGIDF